LATGRALVNWHRTTTFCGRCGSPTEAREGGHVRVCLDVTCNAQHYPRTDNAVIMQVTDGENILLHRQPSWPAGMWSVLAGFVEPGETLEQAVVRETHEETGIIVDDIRYAGSQPWPFPASLMVGFTARAIGGQLCPDPHELEDARWFSRADIAAHFSDAHRNSNAGPYLARPGSIARQMIDAWLKG
jgi:NAD+ diphosphatase